MQLLGKWAKLAQGHVLLGATCSCGIGAGNVRIEEFEQQILDYLDTKYSAAGNAAVAGLLRERAAYRRGQSGSLSALLRSIATEAAKEKHAEWLGLLADLQRTLESFEEVHRGR
jgi:hypothetical protein